MQAGGIEQLNSSSWPDFGNKSLLDAKGLSGDDAASVPVDRIFSLRILISSIYLVVCAVGLLGNSIVMYLVRAQKGRPASTIDVFVFGLALADFHFALTLPFWAVETALDFTWPFGNAMCKLVLTLTVLSVYANVFLLTTMSVTRYCSVASAIRPGLKLTANLAKWITVALWAVALGATIPTAIFATVTDVVGVELCLLKFPTNRWLGVYHLQKVLVAFVVPLVIILASYLLLLSFLQQHRVNANNPRRQSQIATSVWLVVTSFFVCWFPNHVVTFWGALVKFGAVPWDKTFYFLHTYIFPLTTCLAHSNSCLNPVVYCLMRREFRRALKDAFLSLLAQASSYLPSSTGQAREEGTAQVALPLHRRGSPRGLPVAEKEYALLSTTVTVVPELRAEEASLQGEVGTAPGRVSTRRSSK
ncbi:relaxin-3 receptor 2 [Gopherus flavomarginatus]|uniref:relaxin-3 receptor 2 n=1 Tax=Gopherus flavomarginatus TaxID=286002 RepID=UPI0021CC4B36|nr:relaxin-3 receptor 2 [Gopherus flavomarginatus]